MGCAGLRMLLGKENQVDRLRGSSWMMGSRASMDGC